MGGRVYRAKSCLEYHDSVLSAYPQLKLKLYNVLLEEYHEILKLPVDTGFEGSILLTTDDYEFFK